MPSFEINLLQDRCVTCNWYQKPVDIWTLLNYRSCAQLSIRVVLSMALYTEFLGVHPSGSN